MFHSLTQLWKILTPLDRRKLLVVLMLVIIMAFIEAAGVISIMPFLAVLSNPAVVETNILLKKIYQSFALESNSQFIVYLGLISLFIIIFSAAFKIISQYALYRFANLQRHYFSTRLLNIYLQQSYEFFIQRNSSVLVKNVLSETDELVWTLIQPTLLMISYGTVIIAMVVILLFYDPVMAMSTACVLIVCYLGIYSIVKKYLNQIGYSFTQANTGRYQSCQEALSGIKDVMINHGQQGYMSAFEKNSRLYAQHIATRDTLGQVPLHVIETVGYGCLIILAILLVLSGQNVSQILPVLGLYGFAAYRMLPAAQNIYRAITQIKFSESVFKNIQLEFMLEKDFSFQRTKEVLDFNNTIHLENICFSYPNRSDQLILNNLNLVIPKNTSFGIIGRSGSGKSTLMDIMLGLLKPQHGRILIDGIELTQNNISAWYKMVGYVPQNIYLADKTIAENIAFGLALDQVDMQAVYIAAKQAQIHEFIEQQLDKGYMTVVGERGVMLSGGQRQRIGIARALYKNPQILFMDEATSALDSETEQAVNEAIKNLNGKKTMIIIAHRKASLQTCSIIMDLSRKNL